MLCLMIILQGAEPPIFLASSMRYKEIAELLLNHGADPDLKDKVRVQQNSIGSLLFSTVTHCV